MSQYLISCCVFLAIEISALFLAVYCRLNQRLQSAVACEWIGFSALVGVVVSLLAAVMNI